jgi:hypothetical protein
MLVAAQSAHRIQAATRKACLDIPVGNRDRVAPPRQIPSALKSVHNPECPYQNRLSRAEALDRETVARRTNRMGGSPGMWPAPACSVVHYGTHPRLSARSTMRSVKARVPAGSSSSGPWSAPERAATSEFVACPRIFNDTVSQPKTPHGFHVETSRPGLR